MSSGVSKTRVGSVIGTGAVIEVRGVEFRPRVIKLLNVTALARGEWVEGMADDSVVQSVTAGDMTLEVADGITPRSDGFDIGALAALNTATELIRWVAHE